MGFETDPCPLRPDFAVCQVKLSHLDFGHGIFDYFFGSSDGLVPALLWDGVDVLEQLFKRVAALFDVQDALWGQGEVAEFGGGEQHRDEGLRTDCWLAQTDRPTDNVTY